MTDSMGLLLRVKEALARALCAPALGRLVAWWFSDALPSRGCVIRTDDPAIRDDAKAAIFWRLYEGAEIRFVERHLPPDADVVELGASIGVVSAHIARRLEPGRALVCVEANPRLLRSIEANATANARGARVTVVHGAVAYGGAAEVRFAIGERNIDSRLAGSGSPGEVVPAVTLSGVLAAQQLRGFSLVTDIEGAEALVLRRDAGALERCGFIVAELHAAELDGERVDPDALVRQLEGMGFELVERHGPVVAMRRRAAWKART